MASLEDSLAAGRPALILVVGGPNTGKRRLLEEFRARSAAHPCRLVPEEDSDRAEPAWLIVDKQSTIDEFRAAIAPHDDQANASSLARCSLDVILIYGYRPESDLHEWFTGTFIPDIAHPNNPRLVVVAGSAADLVELEPIAHSQVVLGPLPREAVVAELRAIDSQIADHLKPNELEIYADAVVGDPSLLDDLRDVLPLTPAGRPAAEAE